MIYSDSSPVTFNDPLPDSVDVVVIGGGVIGICYRMVSRRRRRERTGLRQGPGRW